MLKETFKDSCKCATSQVHNEIEIEEKIEIIEDSEEEKAKKYEI